jgi:hypothetical protein
MQTALFRSILKTCVQMNTSRINTLQSTSLTWCMKLLCPWTIDVRDTASHCLRVPISYTVRSAVTLVGLKRIGYDATEESVKAVRRDLLQTRVVCYVIAWFQRTIWRYKVGWQSRFCFWPYPILITRISTYTASSRGPGNSVGIATSCGVDVPGIEPRWRRDFSHTFRPALGPTQPPVQGVPGLSRG